jgi:hypothetical protein
MTNHHVAAQALQDIGDKEHDYYRDGFYAKSKEEERKCPGLHLRVLMEIQDVTERVKGAAKAHMTPEQAAAARRQAIAGIEKESSEKTGLSSVVVTLYQGGQYHLYCFKRYTDVRLVFAPEQQIAFYGGDPDNFEYPRYDLDVCFFRVYQNDKPLQPEHYLKWSSQGVSENDLVFVSGHPGPTERMATMDELAYVRWPRHFFQRRSPDKPDKHRPIRKPERVPVGPTEATARCAKRNTSGAAGCWFF